MEAATNLGKGVKSTCDTSIRLHDHCCKEIDDDDL